jgi:hypothetical protein
MKPTIKQNRIAQFLIGALWVAIFTYCATFWVIMWRYMPVLWGLMDFGSKVFVHCSYSAVLLLLLCVYLTRDKVLSDEI